MLRKISIIMITIAVTLCLVAGISVYVNPAIEEIRLNESEKTISIGSYFDLNLGVSPSKIDVEEFLIDWDSSNESVVSVSGGRVRGVSLGTATITATYKGLKAECEVTVEPVYVSSIELEYDYSVIHPNETMQVTATVLPNNATFKGIDWSSSNTSVATITNDGLITGAEVGKTIITAGGANGIEKTFELEVKETIEVESVSIEVSVNPSEVKFALGARQATYVVVPANADVGSVSWGSTNSAVISVDQSGKYTTHTDGYATISVTTANGKTSSLAMYIPKVVADICNIKNSSGKTISNLTMNVGQQHQLKIDINAMKSSDLTYPPIIFVEATTRDIVWTSSDPSKVSVDSNGKLTAHAVTKTQYGMDLGVTITATVSGISKNVYDMITVYVG